MTRGAMRRGVVFSVIVRMNSMSAPVPLLVTRSPASVHPLLFNLRTQPST
jgi:hypothetical protein